MLRHELFSKMHILLTLLFTLQSTALTPTSMKITSLHRYAVKGLSGDSLSSVTFHPDDGTLEDDRRFALLYDHSRENFDENDPSWLHKVGVYLIVLW